MLLLTILLPLVAGCTDRATNGATIGFEHMRGVGGQWPSLIELGDSTAMYSEALGSGWSGPVILFGSEERPERFRWHSSDSTVLAVDGRGVVRARGLGEAAIHAEVDGAASNPWSLRVVVAGVASLRVVEVPERSLPSTRAFEVTALDADGRSIPGIPFYGTLMLPEGAPPLRCAGTPARGPSANITPCDLLVQDSLVTEPVLLRVIMPLVVGRSESVEAEIPLQPR